MSVCCTAVHRSCTGHTLNNSRLQTAVVANSRGTSRGGIRGRGEYVWDKHETHDGHTAHPGKSTFIASEPFVPANMLCVAACRLTPLGGT
jgi:hypothetical protein